MARPKSLQAPAIADRPQKLFERLEERRVVNAGRHDEAAETGEVISTGLERPVDLLR
jgi:hypothetical protein